MSGFLLSGPILHNLARNAYLETDRERSDRSSQPHHKTLISIVFSVSSLELFINELSELTGAWFDTPERTPNAVSALGSVLREAEESHGSTKLKYLLAYSVLTGKPWDKSGEDFENFALLIDVRNALIHMKPSDRLERKALNEIEFRPNRLLRKLEGKAVLTPDGATKKWEPWTIRINTRAMARWACNVSAKTTAIIADVFPECLLKSAVDTMVLEPVD